jgi:hypothetical protein
MDPRKHEADDEEEAFLSQSGSYKDVAVDSSSGSQRRGSTTPPKWGLVSWLRLLLEITMATTILYLLVFKPFVVGRETLRRTPVPKRKLAKLVIPSRPTTAN